MKGHPAGRGRGFNPCGRIQASNQGGTAKAKQESRKGLSNYVYYIGSAKQASDYVVVTKYLINYIRKTYTFGDDIGNALETRTALDFATLMPTMSISTNADVAEKAREDKQFEMLYEAEIASYVKRKDMYSSNLGNAYALIFGQCNKAMQNKIQARADFESEVKHNPIKLLDAIQEHSISYQENKYEMSIISDALKNLVNLKQKEDESLIDYTGRFKSARDILTAQIGGPLKLTKYVGTIGSV
jgi:hypothetical protein